MISVLSAFWHFFGSIGNTHALIGFTPGLVKILRGVDINEDPPLQGLLRKHGGAGKFPAEHFFSH
jgi:hypothetical protein